MAFFVCHVKSVVCNNILTLTKSDNVEMLDWIHLLFDAKSLNILDWVGTWRKDEEDWSRSR